MATFKTNSRRAQWSTMQTIDSATFTGSYQKLGVPLPQPGAIVKMVNNSGALVTISDDGTNDKDVLLANQTGFIYDFGSDAQSSANSERMALAAGTQLWVKASSSTGLVYLVVIFQGE